MNRIRFGLWTVILSALVGAATAQAQGFPVDRFALAVRADDGFHTARLDRFGHGRFGLVIAGDYAWNPLILDAVRGSDQAVVDRQLALHANLSLSLADRVIFFAGLRASAVLDGDPIREAFENLVGPADGAGLGDTVLGARLRLVGADKDVFALGLQLSATLATAQLADGEQRYRGEHSAALTPLLIAELRSKIVRVTANVGAHVREDTSLVGATIGDEFRCALAVGVRPVPALELLAEGYGAIGFEDFGSEETAELEWLAGAKLYHPAGFTAGVAAGTGIPPAIGSPDARVVLLLGLLTEGKVRKAGPPPPVVPLDVDFDGVPDDGDACKHEPEDRDGFQDEDGCPDPDNDTDGVLDAADRCGNEAEDKDGFQDEDGCPDPDNDTDGLPDATDQCPDEAEDFDAFVDDDGCLDPDNDKDKVEDGVDECPMDPGSPDNRGCPKSIRIEEGGIRLLQQLNFANNSDVILPDSTPILVEIRDALGTHANIQRVRIEGHTDDRGADKKNLELSKRRAASVTRWLTEQGTSPARLEAWGCGEVQPIESNKTADGRAKNRRVVFTITDPAPRSGVQPPAAGCEAVGAIGPKPAAATAPAKPRAPAVPAAPVIAPGAPSSATPPPPAPR